MTNDSAALTVHETEELERLESIIERGAFEIGEALRRIREGRLYRQDYPTFEEYCFRRWKFSDTQADRLILAAGAMENLSNTPIGVLPTNEAQARPLTVYNDQPEIQRAIWDAAVETAPDTGITARHVTNVVSAVRESIADGVEPREAVNRLISAGHVPTPSQADTLARIHGLIVPASDGRYHDGQPSNDAAIAREQAERFAIFGALQALAESAVPPAAFVIRVRPDQEYRVATHLDAAVAWLTSFAEEWTACH